MRSSMDNTLFPTLGILGRGGFSRYRKHHRDVCEDRRGHLPRKYTSYSYICVYMDVSKFILESICLLYEDLEWI